MGFTLRLLVGLSAGGAQLPQRVQEATWEGLVPSPAALRGSLMVQEASASALTLMTHPYVSAWSLQGQLS